MWLQHCDTLWQCLRVCALGGEVLPPSCCYVMTGIAAPSPLSTGGVIHTVPSARCWLRSHKSTRLHKDSNALRKGEIHTHSCASNVLIHDAFCWHGLMLGGILWSIIRSPSGSWRVSLFCKHNSQDVTAHLHRPLLSHYLSSKTNCCVVAAVLIVHLWSLHSSGSHLLLILPVWRSMR